MRSATRSHHSATISPMKRMDPTIFMGLVRLLEQYIEIVVGSHLAAGGREYDHLHRYLLRGASVATKLRLLDVIMDDLGWRTDHPDLIPQLRALFGSRNVIAHTNWMYFGVLGTRWEGINQTKTGTEHVSITQEDLQKLYGDFHSAFEILKSLSERIPEPAGTAEGSPGFQEALDAVDANVQAELKVYAHFDAVARRAAGAIEAEEERADEDEI